MAVAVFTLIWHAAQPSGKPHGTVAVTGDWLRHPASTGRPLLPRLSPAQRLTDRIKQQYRVRLILDNLPITTYDLELDPESGEDGVDCVVGCGWVRYWQQWWGGVLRGDGVLDADACAFMALPHPLPWSAPLCCSAARL